MRTREDTRLATTEPAESTEPRKRGRARPGLLGSALTLLAGACGTGSFYMLSATLATFIETDKLPTDYIAEFASGKECRTVVAIKDGGPLCRDSFAEPKVYEKPIWCYRTLGAITCYSEPDPYKTNAQPVR